MALLLAIVVGCVPRPHAERQLPLTEIHEFYINVNETAFSVELSNISGSQYRPCDVALPDLQAQLDGLALSVATYGGKLGENASDDGAENECAVPRLSVETPPLDHASHLRMSDHSGTIDCELPDLKAMRQVMLVPAGPWELTSGQPVTVQWSPSGDLRLRAISVELWTLKEPGHIAGPVYEVDDEAIQGDLVTFTLPTAPPGLFLLLLRPARSGATCMPESVFAILRSSVTTFGSAKEITIVP